MTENTPKPRIRVIKKQIEGIRLSFGSLLLILCCTFLIILSTFIQFNVNHFIIPMGLFKGEQLSLSDYIYTYKLIPQIPVVMFVGAFLGRRYGITSILLYILLGLFIIPVFALGGGPSYVLEYSFGYILTYIPAVFFAGSILKSAQSMSADKWDDSFDPKYKEIVSKGRIQSAKDMGKMRKL